MERFKMYQVSITKVKDNQLKKAINDAMDLVNWRSLIKKGGTTVVKPNMGCFVYVPGVITRPEVIYHVVSNLKTWAGEVIVGESEGTHYSCDEAYVNTGVKEAVEKAGGKIVNFSKLEQIPVHIDNGLHWKDVKLPKILVEADSFVSIPVIKTHETTLLTCAIKNQFGCYAEKYRNLEHHWIHEIIVDLNSAIKPDLVVTDGTICMEGNGPIHGPAKELGIILASNNVLANDLVATQIMKFDALKIKHLINAMKVGLGPSNINEVTIIGMDLSNFSNVKFAPIKLDLVSKATAFVSNNRILTKVLFDSPIIYPLYRIAWAYRGVRGTKKRVGIS
jgi:uncharacterized protein (DUF362 family)